MGFKIVSAFCGLFVASAVSAANLSDGLTPADLRVFGNPAAPATVYVFSSPTCPHCATFHKAVLPALKKQYADTGVAKIVPVDMPFDPKAMTGTMMARCVAPAHYESFMDTLYRNQAFWTRLPNARETMMGYAKSLGESEQAMNKCLADKNVQKTVSTQRDNLGRMYRVRGTPAVVAVKGGQSKLLTGTDKPVILNELNLFLGVKND